MIFIRLEVLIPSIIVGSLIFILGVSRFIYAISEKYLYKRKIKLKLKDFVSRMNDAKIERTKQMPYDYRIESLQYIYYIKFIRCDKDRNLHIDSRDDIYFKKSLQGKKVKTRGIIPLLNTNLEDNSKKEIKKIFIIYPRSRFIIYKQSEYLEEYVYPDKKIFGAYYISGEDFLNMEEFK